MTPLDRPTAEPSIGVQTVSSVCTSSPLSIKHGMVPGLLPAELWTLIIESMGRAPSKDFNSLSLVSKHFYHATRPVRLASHLARRAEMLCGATEKLEEFEAILNGAISLNGPNNRTDGIQYLPNIRGKYYGVKLIVSEAALLPSSEKAIVLSNSPTVMRHLSSAKDFYRTTTFELYFEAVKNLPDSDIATGLAPLIDAMQYLECGQRTTAVFEKITEMICPAATPRGLSFDDCVNFLFKLLVVIERWPNLIRKFDAFTRIVNTASTLRRTHATDSDLPVALGSRETASPVVNLTYLDHVISTATRHILDIACPEDGDVTGDFPFLMHANLLSQLPALITRLPAKEIDLKRVVFSRIAATARTLLTRKDASNASEVSDRSRVMAKVLVNLTAMMAQLEQTQAIPPGQDLPRLRPKETAYRCISGRAEYLCDLDKHAVLENLGDTLPDDHGFAAVG